MRRNKNKTEAIQGEFFDRVAEACYYVAVKWGFPGSFLAFLCDFQKALEHVVKGKGHA